MFNTRFVLSKYLTKLLSPLCKIQYTDESTKDFISFIKTQKIPSNHRLESLDGWYIMELPDAPFAPRIDK